ncbi:MAG: TonB-dependent receptor, partial [Caulobacteraceae bacterium]|nr:TonB-dependent receptor [Caulobacteraceae bacterium]
IDGVYQSFLPATDLQFNDVQRIEVLKGPQGALLGRNAMGGAINIITKDPTATPHADASVSYGSYNQVIAKGYVSGGADVVAASLAAVVNRDDGYIHDIVNGKEYGHTDDVSVRGKLVFHPTSHLDLKIAVAHTSNDEDTGEAFRNLDGNTLAARFHIPGNVIATAPYTSAMTFDPYNKVFETDVSGTAIYHGDGFNITAISAYEDAKLKISADADATPAPLADYFYKQFSRNEYNEIYIQSENDKPYNWLAGVVYYHDHSGNPPDLKIDLNFAGVHLATFDNVYTDSYAGYGQFGYKFNDQWSLTVGGRYTSEHKSFNNFDGPTGALLASNSATFSKFTPTGTLQYQPNQQWNFYVKAGQAFKSGVFNPSARDAAAAAPVRPETLTQYEIGAKAALSSRVQFNLAAYYTDYTNLQSSIRLLDGTSALQNAGKATIYGVEAEAFLQPIDHLNMRLGVSALHGTYGNYTDADVYYPTTTGTSGTPSGYCATAPGTPIGGNTEETPCNVNGKTIMRTPTLTADASADYHIPTEVGEFSIVGSVYYQGKSYWDAANVFEENPYTLLNARIGWRSPDKRYGVSVWGENLTDAIYSVTQVIGVFGDSQVLAKPRTWGVEWTYDW